MSGFPLRWELLSDKILSGGSICAHFKKDSQSFIEQQCMLELTPKRAREKKDGR